MLATNLLKKDVTSSSVPTITLPLITLPHLITSSLALSLLSDLLPRLSHSNPSVRKKTVVALYRLALVYPESLRPAWPKIKDLLMNEEEDSSVTAAAINVVCELGWRRPLDFLPLAPRLFELLVDGGNNWMAIKIIKLFATLTPLEPRLVKKLLPPLATLIRTTPAMSLLYECINGIISGGILESVDGAREGEEVAALCVGKLREMIIVEGDPNLKYVALLAFKKIAVSHPALVSLHQDVIMSCIDDQDVSIRLQALDLSAGIVNKENVIELVDRLLQQLRRAPSTTSGAEDDRSAAVKVEPTADSDGEDPGEILRLSYSRHESGSAITSEYRIAMIKQVLDMCAKDTYANIPDFEWYINTLVQLVGLVPFKSGSNFTERRRTQQQPSSGCDLTAYQMAADIGREIRNVAVRVHSVRSEAVQAAASLLLIAEEYQTNISPQSGRGGELPFAAWVVGEYADQLSNLDGTLTTLTNSKAGILPPTVLCAYLQSIPKLLACVISRISGEWTAERQTTASLLLARLLYYLEPLTSSPSLEVQERAVELAELLKLASQAVADHTSHSDQWPLLLTAAIRQLYSGPDLNPVAPSAQARVPFPDDLDLELPLNSDLAKILISIGEAVSPDVGAKDFELFYSKRTDRKIREAEPATETSCTVRPVTSSYQSTEDSDTDPSLAKRNRLERSSRNRDDPYYIASDPHSSGTSTPFHDIIRNTNGEGVDVDSIPIMDLDLGDGTDNNNYSGRGQDKLTTRHSKTYQIATDETVETDDSSDPQRTTLRQLRASTTSQPGARGASKRSLLEVDSSGLGVVSMEGTPSAATQLELEKQEYENEEMARALREVERLRLEMQRASERVYITKGMPAEGTLVKKKRKKKTKPGASTRLGTDSGLISRAEDEGYADNMVSDKSKVRVLIVKRKKKKPIKTSESQP
ncbi:MAG: hypothetical protein Q9207_007557 [Kuettlingeria erythrocarpa]